MKVNLHSTLLDNIHHIERQNDWFFQFQKLQRQIKVSLQRRRIHDIDDHIHIIFLDTPSRDELLHRIGSQAVNSGRVDHMDLSPLVTGLPFHSLDGNTGPVGNL